MVDDQLTLPRSTIERVVFGAVCLVGTLMFGFVTVVVVLTPMPPLGPFGTLIRVATEELSLAVTAVAVLGFLWAVATPEWVERLFRYGWKKLRFAIVFALVPIALLTVLAAFGLKLGAGLGP